MFTVFCSITESVPSEGITFGMFTTKNKIIGHFSDGKSAAIAVSKAHKDALKYYSSHGYNVEDNGPGPFFRDLSFIVHDGILNEDGQIVKNDKNLDAECTISHWIKEEKK